MAFDREYFAWESVDTEGKITGIPGQKVIFITTDFSKALRLRETKTRKIFRRTSIPALADCFVESEVTWNNIFIWFEDVRHEDEQFLQKFVTHYNAEKIAKAVVIEPPLQNKWY